MSKTNETRCVSWNETCACKTRVHASFCNDKQRCNKDKFRCKCKEIIDKGWCEDGFICNPSMCEFQYDKLYDVGEYVDYVNCKCRERLIDSLILECEDEVLNTAKVWFDDKKTTCEKIIALFPLFC